jgi:hypothetical protein
MGRVIEMRAEIGKLRMDLTHLKARLLVLEQAAVRGGKT